MQHLLSIDEINEKQIYELFHNAEILRGMIRGQKNGIVTRPCTEAQNKVMATLFFEPSTRTRLSFEVAMKRLGGEVVSAIDCDSLSIAKGESVSDTIETVAQMCDVVVVRAASRTIGWVTSDRKISVPIINAGDGIYDHPTQALLDLYTIWRHYGQPKNIYCHEKLVHCIAGDVANSRTIRAYARLMLKTSGNMLHVYDSTHRGGRLRDVNDVWHNVIYYDDQQKFEAQIKNCDVLYLNRVQTERHSESEKLEEATFRISGYLINLMKPTGIVLNPGPRKDELPYPTCRFPKVRMLEQVENGMYLRMALLQKLLKRSYE